MKKLLIIMMQLAFIVTSFGQQPLFEKRKSYADYLEKSQNQNTAAWILTGVGTTGLLATVVIEGGQALGGLFARALSDGTIEPDHSSLTVPYLLSLASIAGGITLFIASGKSRRAAKAASAYLKIDNTIVLQPLGIKNHSHPSVGVRLAL